MPTVVFKPYGNSDFKYKIVRPNLFFVLTYNVVMWFKFTP